VAVQRCPECGVVREEWAARWSVRVAELGLTLSVWGLGAGVCVWLGMMAVSRFSAGGAQLVGRRSATELLMLGPAVMLAAGIVLLCRPPGVRGRKAACAAAVLLAVASAFLAMAKTVLGADLPGMDSPFNAWTEGARLLLMALAPIAIATALAQAGGIARRAGLERLGRRSRKAAAWLPAAAIGGAVAMVVYDMGAGDAADRARQAALPLIAAARLPPQWRPPWYLTTGVDLGWTLLYTFLALAAAGVWTVLVVVRLRVREVLGEGGRARARAGE
jgi:hypothetical protein